MRILAIESSCDETAAAVVEDGSRVISNAVASQTALHRVYKGVVPELASRSHIQHILPVISEALRLAGSDAQGAGIDAVAVTRGPGLVGSLLVGVETAKSLAWQWGKPLIAVHHIMGHLHSIFCDLPEGCSRLLDVATEEYDAKGSWRSDTPDGDEAALPPSPLPAFNFPYLGLAISGGHSSLVRVDAPTQMRVLGSTLDDAPGEAYDKVAKCLGLCYPGGPEVDRRAARGDPEAFALPRPVLHSHGYDFSFSGLKTAVVRVIEDQGGPEKFHSDETLLNDLCASFQAAVVDVLLTKTQRALRNEKLRRLAVVGGVACNRGLRREAARRLRGSRILFPPPILCTDNAAMIAAAAAHIEPLSAQDALSLNARSGWDIGDLNEA